MDAALVGHEPPNSRTSHQQARVTFVSHGSFWQTDTGRDLRRYLCRCCRALGTGEEKRAKTCRAGTLGDCSRRLRGFEHGTGGASRRTCVSFFAVAAAYSRPNRQAVDETLVSSASGNEGAGSAPHFAELICICSLLRVSQGSNWVSSSSFISGIWMLIGTRSSENRGWDMWDLSNQYVAVVDTTGLIPRRRFWPMIVLHLAHVVARGQLFR